MTAAPDPDLIDVLVVDHRRVEQLFTELEAGLADLDRRTGLVGAVIAELRRHAADERAYLYPVTCVVLPDGEEIVGRQDAEQGEIEQLLADLTEADGNALAQVIALVRHHVDDQEGDLFPRLRQALPPDELLQLGRRVEAAKKIAPTRPHPSAPDRPPLNKLVAPGAGLLDRVRDALTNRPTSPADL